MSHLQDLVRTGRIVLGSALILMTVACGSESTGPTPIPQPPPQTGLPAGRYSFVAGVGLTASCTGDLAGWSLFGPSVAGSVVVAVEENGWTGHAESGADGDLTFRLRPSTTASGADMPLSGTVTGSLFHALDRFTPPARSITFAGTTNGSPAAIEMSLFPLASGSSAIGSASGQIAFRNGTGGIAVCSSVSVVLGPAN